MRAIVWFRGKDLRLDDHQPLQQAAQSSELLPVFVLEPHYFGEGRAAEAPARMQFMLESLRTLDSALIERGSRLLVVPGPSQQVIPELVSRYAVDRVVAHRATEPGARAAHRSLTTSLGGRLELYDGETLAPPGTLRTLDGRPYSVYSHFARAFHERVVVAPPIAAPDTLPPLPSDARLAATEIPTCEALGLQPNPSIVKGGFHEARDRLMLFVRTAAGYPLDRDRMDRPATSRISADLKFGTLSVRRAWTEAEAALGNCDAGAVFKRQLLWREFAYSTLWDRPQLLSTPFRTDFDGFPWRRAPLAWKAWTQGKTGYPIVDAAARQLLGEGFVHNRARMVAASFLTKHLLIDYRAGEAHYMKHLVDGDWAQNNCGWQWSAGCGCDAQPYFRVFNPVIQGKKFDPDGLYVQRWVPELAELPARFIHRPWEAPKDVLCAAGVELGTNYPKPMVDHRFARERFLAVAASHRATDHPAP